jgi:hypothetical protein
VTVWFAAGAGPAGTTSSARRRPKPAQRTFMSRP